MFGKKKKDENEQKTQAEAKAKPEGKQKVSKGFGNTIILFIVFFIVFTVIVTGVAFFADKIDMSGGNDKNIEDLVPAEKMTDPKEGENTEYVMDEKGNLGKKEIMEPMLDKPVKKQEEAPIPKANSKVEKPAAKPAPLPPIKVAPEIKKPKPKPKPTPKPAPKPALSSLSSKKTTGDYVVQMASFRSKKTADAEAAKLRRRIPSVFVVRADLGEKGIWYRLRAYKGISRPEAVAKGAEIAKITNYKPYPMKK